MQPPQRNPGKPLQLWFQDEARVGNKGRVCHRWWLKGERAPGRAQQGYQWAYIFAAIPARPPARIAPWCRRSSVPP
jgi:hypothetical protein